MPLFTRGMTYTAARRLAKQQTLRPVFAGDGGVVVNCPRCGLELLTPFRAPGLSAPAAEEAAKRARTELVWHLHYGMCQPPKEVK